MTCCILRISILAFLTFLLSFRARMQFFYQDMVVCFISYAQLRARARSRLIPHPPLRTPIPTFKHEPCFLHSVLTYRTPRNYFKWWRPAYGVQHPIVDRKLTFDVREMKPAIKPAFSELEGARSPPSMSSPPPSLSLSLSLARTSTLARSAMHADVSALY